MKNKNKNPVLPLASQQSPSLTKAAREARHFSPCRWPQTVPRGIPSQAELTAWVVREALWEEKGGQEQVSC